MLRALGLFVVASFAVPAAAQTAATAGSMSSEADVTSVQGYDASGGVVPGNGSMAYGTASGYGQSQGYAPGSTQPAGSVSSAMNMGSINWKTGRIISSDDQSPDTAGSRSILDSYSTSNNTGIVGAGATYDPH